MPANRYDDHFHKIQTYTAYITGPAKQKDPSIDPYTFRDPMVSDLDSVFNFRDTLTSRANISDVVSKISDDNIAVIGLGGTGAYILDFLAKSQVKSIKGFDNKKYYIHTSFRSPGSVSISEFGKSKSEVYQGRYSDFRKNIKLETKYIDSSTRDLLDGITFAFVCVDKSNSRSNIFNLLQELHIPFIDVGMGLKVIDNSLRRSIRTTFFQKMTFNQSAIVTL